MSNFKPWIDVVTSGTSRNCLTALDFDTDNQRIVGFKGGTPASALRVNSGLRQANLVVAALMDSILPNDTTLSLVSSVDDVKNAISAKLVKDIITSGTQIGLSYYDNHQSMITVPFATSATNLTGNPSITANGNNVRITVGGKTSSDFTVPYATKSLQLSSGKGSDNTPVYFDNNGNPQTVTGLAKNLTISNGVISYIEDGTAKTLDTATKLYEHNIHIYTSSLRGVRGLLDMYVSFLSKSASPILTVGELASLKSRACSGYFKNSDSNAYYSIAWIGPDQYRQSLEVTFFSSTSLNAAEISSTETVTDIVTEFNI